MNIVYTHSTGNYRVVESNNLFVPQRGTILRAAVHAPATVAWEACETHRDTSAAYLRWVPKSFKTLKGAISYINNQ